MTDTTTEAASLAETIARIAKDTERTIAVAESLTGGALSSTLASAPDAADWYAGGVIAYRKATKQRLLGVDEGPVVTADCAIQMARGVRELLAVDLSVALTGVGGPGQEEGQPPGTVFIAVGSQLGEQVHRHRFEGTPETVVTQTVEQALRHLRDELLRER
ncbi:MAG TPA: CinA family protein [Microbacteriaceae bacterium]|nr:CinA family protein [Microbacteriaceae bacterium]